MNSNELDFIVSGLTEFNPWTSTSKAREWLSSRAKAHTFRVERVSFAELDKWRFETSTRNLVHDSGKFLGLSGFPKDNWLMQ